MEAEIFEVSRDEYRGYLSQLAPDSTITVHANVDDYEVSHIYSRKTRKKLAASYMPTNPDLPTRYFVIEMPEDEERIAPKPVQKFELQTPEEVRSFFEILNKLSSNKDKTDD